MFFRVCGDILLNYSIAHSQRAAFIREYTSAPQSTTTIGMDRTFVRYPNAPPIHLGRPSPVVGFRLLLHAQFLSLTLPRDRSCLESFFAKRRLCHFLPGCEQFPRSEPMKIYRKGYRMTLLCVDRFRVGNV